MDQVYVDLNFPRKLIEPIKKIKFIFQSIAFFHTSWGISVVFNDVGLALLIAHWQQGNWQVVFVQVWLSDTTELIVRKQSNENVRCKNII